MDVLYAAEERIVWQEVPDEVSLAFLISGCPLKCRGCHSAYARCPFIGQPLTQDYLEKRLLDYQGLLSCVLFLGGEWQLTALLACLMLVRSHGLKTCLYTGLDDIDARLMAQLTYVKLGAWKEALGGLASETTNQRFIRVADGADLTYRFRGVARC